MKARRVESGTRGKQNNNLKNKNRIINEVNKIISEELRFLNGHYEYDLRQYCNPGLIYGSCFLTFFNLESIKDPFPDETIHVNNYYKDGTEKNFVHTDTYRILNLIAGFELLGIGINIHGMVEKALGEIYHEKKNSTEDDSEKNYTLKLLFGDIFYSRAVIYFINYNDFFVFEEILNSLLALHYARLITHQELVKIISQSSEEKIFKKLKEDIAKIKNLNALLKSAFLIGFGASNFTLDFNELGLSFRIIEDLVSFKTYFDIENHLRQISAEVKSSCKDGHLNFILSKKMEIMGRVNKDIKLIKPQWLKDNFDSLTKLFQTLY